MQKIVKNWIFTLVMSVVLTLVAVWMLLDGAGVADRFYTQSIIHEITAIFVICYVLLVLFPMVPRYQKTVRFFALGEIALLLLVVVGIFFNAVDEIRFIEKMVLCSVVGLVIWLRSAVEIINAFLTPANEEGGRIPLWRLCLYILIAALGVWQMASPAIGNRYLIFPISTLTLLIAAGFGVATVRNRRAARVTPSATDPAMPVASEENAESQEAPAEE